MCAANFGKVAKCTAEAKRLRTTALTENIYSANAKVPDRTKCCIDQRSHVFKPLVLFSKLKTIKAIIITLIRQLKNKLI